MPRVMKLGAALGVAALYVAGAKLGFTMPSAAEQVTAVWPPSGIALAAALVLGRWVWPGVTLGAFVANAMAHEPLAAAAGIAVGNTLEVVTAAWILERLDFRPSLQRLRDVVALFVWGAVASTTVAATIGSLSLCAFGVHPWTSFVGLWWVWWLGDASGDLIVAPLLLVSTTLGRDLPTWTRRWGEAVAMMTVLLLVGLIAFSARPDQPWAPYPSHYVVFPFVIWSALRFGQRGTTLVVFVVASVAVWSTVHTHGPFVLPDVHDSLIQLDLFMAVVAITALLLGAAISERDAAERRALAEYQSLGRSEERLRLALEAGRMGVWEWNIPSGAVSWSAELERIHGLGPGEFAGTYDAFRRLIHADDRDRVERAVGLAVERGTPYDVEFRNVRADGVVGWLAAKGVVVRDAAGRSQRMIGTAADVTPRRHLEEQLRERAQQLAEQDRRKDEFLAMLAHELRNPLAPLSTVLHLLTRGTNDGARLLGIADRQLKHLVRLVDDLLDVSRITRGKIALRREVVALADVVGRTVEMVRAAIDARGHDLTVTLPPEPVYVDVDPARLEQVLANLLTNAAKYTPSQGLIGLVAERRGGEVEIRVRDTGVGLSPELLPHVFDLFVQGDTSLDRTRGGLGIGLTIVRRLVEMHGGRVAVRSAGPGQGSEFSVILPMSAGRPTISAPAAAPDLTQRPLEVLVVEDNRDGAEALATVLRVWGHEVRVAFDGLAALEMVEQAAPDVVLSDLGLPGMDGYELARRLRQRTGGPRPVLVALSGYARDEERQRARDAGFVHHLVKPPALDTLAELLGRIARNGG